MIYTTPLTKYVRSSVPTNPQSQVLFLTEELKKLERTIQSLVAALEQIGGHVP